MAVSVTFALAPGGVAIAGPVDHGTIAGGGTGAAVTLFVRHDGINPITNCGWYIAPYAGSGYTGDNGQQADYDDILGWGPAAGFMIDQGGGFVGHAAGAGDPLNPIAVSGSAAPPDIASAEEISIDVQVSVPGGATAALRFIDHCLKFTYTS